MGRNTIREKKKIFFFFFSVMRVACWVKFSADDIHVLKYFSYYCQKTGFDISCRSICGQVRLVFPTYHYHRSR